MSDTLENTVTRPATCRVPRLDAEDDFGAPGDTSTLSDPSVAQKLIENRLIRTRVSREAGTQ